MMIASSSFAICYVDGNKYCCIGAQLRRAQEGIQSGLSMVKGGQIIDPSSFMNIFRPLFKKPVEEEGGVNADEQEGMYNGMNHVLMSTFYHFR